MLSLLSLIFTTSACLSFARASPLYTDSHTTSLETRQGATCKTLSSGASTTCWDQLDIANYLTSWNRTTPNCAATGGDGANCCQGAEPWTTCFLRLAYGAPGSDCTGINPQACVLNQLSPTLGPSIATKVQYVVRNIVNINGVFAGFRQALASGNVYGDSSVSAKLYQFMNNGATLNDGNIVKALVAGLPFWGKSTVLASGPQQITPTVNSDAALAFAQSLQNATAVSSMLLGAAYDINDFSKTQAEVAIDTANAENLLDQALKLIMSDVPTFIAWAAGGLYSGSTSFSLPSPAPGIVSAFTTYAVGEILSQAHFSATPISRTSSNAKFQQDRTCTPLGDVCKDSSNKAYYRSPLTNIQYQINEPGNWVRTSGLQTVIAQSGYEDNAYGLMSYLETTNVYMPVLFDGAYNCTLEGKAGGSAVNVNADGSLDIACLSALPIYLLKGTGCPGTAVMIGINCPFGFMG